MKCAAIFLLSIWVLLVVVQVGCGVMSADLGPLWNECTAPPARYQYVVPGFKLGCWLGEVPDAARK